MNIEFDFNEPLVVQALLRGFFRETLPVEEGEEPQYKDTEREHITKVVVGWEDVKMIKGYPYPDDWKEFKGEKYYLTLHGYDMDILVLGSMDTMVKYWTLLRTKYPCFVDVKNEEDEY